MVLLTRLTEPASHLLPDAAADHVGTTVRAGRRHNRRLDAFPRRSSARWALRLALALPLLVATFISYFLNSPLIGTPNAELMQRVAQIDWTRGDAAWLGGIYPPISTVLAVIVPGGRVGLAVLGSLAGGILLQKLIEIARQRRLNRSTSVILLVAVAANPLFFYTATENFAGFAGLIFFGLAIADVVRFASWADTQSGFRAGLFFMLAALTDSAGLIYVLTALVAVPFLTLRRQGQPGARLSTLLIIGYPTFASIGAMTALSVVFLGTPFGQFGVLDLGGTGQRLASLPGVFSSMAGWLLLASVGSAWLCAAIVGRWRAIPVSTLVLLSILLAFVVGLKAPGSAGNTFIMMTMLAIALIPAAKGPTSRLLLNLVAVAQIGIGWLAAVDRPIVHEWMRALWTGLVGAR